MSGTVDERLARIVHNATFKVYGHDSGTHTTGQAACQEMTRQLSKSLADSGVVLVEREALAKAIDEALSTVDDEATPDLELAGLVWSALRSEDPA